MNTIIIILLSLMGMHPRLFDNEGAKRHHNAKGRVT